MTVFEYKILHYAAAPNAKVEKEWNVLGKEGWELVSFGPTGLEIGGSTVGGYGFVDGDVKGGFGKLTAVFKRLKG